MADISKIQVPIEGVMTEFNIKGSGGSANYYGTCTGQAANQTKVVTISSDQGFELKTGVLIFVKFDANNTYSATASNPVKLNVNNTGAKQIYAADTSAPTGTNITYFGRTNYINQYIYNGAYWVWNGSSSDNTVNTQVRYGDTVKAAAAVTASTICVGTSSGYKTAASGITFDISYPLLYAGSAVSSGSTRTNFYRVINGCSSESLKSGFSGVAYSTCYLVLSSISGNIATIDSTVYTVTPNVEGKMYIPIGIFCSIIKINIDLTMSSIYIYKDGELKLYSPNSGGGGGSGLPDEVITYDQFRAKTDEQQAAYTGYVTGWPDGGSSVAGKWTNPVLCEIGDTDVTITDSKILTSSAIDVYTQTASGTEVPHSSVVVTAGQAVVTFSYALEENAYVRLNILDTSSQNWTAAVSCDIGDTEATITDDNIYTTSIIKTYCEVASGVPIVPTSTEVTTGQVDLTFDALTEATNIKLFITNL